VRLVLEVAGIEHTTTAAHPLDDSDSDRWDYY